MSLVIDGYNVLHVVGILGRGVGPGSLRRSRLALLNFLAESLDPQQVAHTTVVFDARQPPYGLPRTVKHRGLTVCFSSGYEDADSQIEELIRTDSAPRRMTVVSSDHRIQRAARRRKARAVDSDAWYAEIVAERRRRQQESADAPIRPPVPLLEEDVNYWIRQFGGESELQRLVDEEETGDTPTSPEEPAAEERPAEEPATDKPSAEEPADLDDIFPPGYADDLLAEEEPDDPLNPFPPGYGEDLT